MKDIYNFTQTDIVLVEYSTTKPLCIIPVKYKATKTENSWIISPAEYERDWDIPSRQGNFNIIEIAQYLGDHIARNWYLLDLENGKKYNVVDNITAMSIKNFSSKYKVNDITDIILLTNKSTKTDNGSIVYYDISKYDNIEEFSKIIKDQLEKYTDKNIKNTIHNLKIIADHNTPMLFVLAIIKESILIRDSIIVEIEYPDHVECIEL